MSNTPEVVEVPRSAAAIEREIASLEARRGELAAQLLEAEAALELARADLVAGVAKTPTKVTQAQATYTALSQATAALDAQLAQLRADLMAAQAHAAGEAALDRLVELSRAAAAGRAELEAGYQVGEAALAAALGQMLAGMQAWSLARQEFQIGLRALAPGLTYLHYRDDGAAEAQLRHVLAELERRGADLRAGLAHGLWAGRTAVEHDYALPDLPFGWVVARAFQVLREQPKSVAELEQRLDGHRSGAE